MPEPDDSSQSSYVLEMTLADALIGTWRLLSRKDRLPNGEVRPEPTLGSDPHALLIYDRGGNFAAQFMKRDRSVLPDTPTVATQANNNSSAVGGYDAYFGRYTVDGNLVTQTLVASLSPADVGKVVTREMTIIDDMLVIRIELSAADGVAVVRTLRWSREA
jgi:hypothetical protein